MAIKNEGKIASDNESKKSEIIEIEQELKEINPNVFDGINARKKVELLQTFRKVSVVEKHHSGPLPDSDTIIAYDSVIPNGADRIMIMAEKQQDHRIAMENKVVGHQLGESRLGQIFGFVLCMISLGCSTYLGYSGHEAIGAVMGGTTIIGLATIFVLGKKPKNENKTK